jgi:3-oxoacyl-[acyl-carrier protein] reductase
VDLGLQGKVALITGGSEGIGKATAKGFAMEGAHVAICARNDEPLRRVETEIRAAGGECFASAADVRRAEEIERFVRDVQERYGRIDILINNAGTLAAASLLRVPDEEWENDLDLKLMAAIRTSRLVIPVMQQQGGGRVINLTAISGKQPGARTLPTAVSRAAGIALVKALSREFAGDQILVNTICIGMVRSGQLDRRMGRDYPQLSLDAAYAEEARRFVPIGWIADPSQAADLILFLCSERARYITGVAINFDGGQSAVV